MICHANSETDKVIFFHHSTGKNACLDLFLFGISDSETDGWIFMFVAHSDAPRIISTFLESYDFSGKTILPFYTSHSSGIGSSADNLHILCSDSAVWLDGKRFEAGTSKEIIEEWIGSMIVN